MPAPRWVTTTKVWAAWSRRHGLNAPAQQILTGILPVAQVDKHWLDDRIELWGLFMQQPGTAVPGRLGACTLLTQRKEAIVHKIEAQLTIISASPGTIANVHLFTPIFPYLPTAVNAFIVFPWLQPISAPDPGRLARSFGLIGETDAGLQVVTVDGAPHTSVGPSYSLGTYAAGLVGGRRHVLWSFQDPPLRVKPGQQLTVQLLDVLPAALALQVNFYFSEREFQGDVG